MTVAALWDLPAPAKINAFLHITGRRADGYHLLQSVFVLIGWSDTLHLELRQDGAIHRRDLGASLPPDDLCLRAARLLQMHTGCRQGVDISIDKQVPWGAGMGGGSSDAATVLIGLNRLWQLKLSRDTLRALALQLGADVPFFLGSGCAWVEGIGEVLTPMSLPSQGLAVLKPAMPVPTKEVFSSPLLQRSTKPDTVIGFPAHNRWLQEIWVDRWHNDMQAAAQSICPDVGVALRHLADQFGHSRMTGSGSAVFAPVSSKMLEDALGKGGPLQVADLPGLTPDMIEQHWQGKICRSLEHHPLAGW